MKRIVALGVALCTLGFSVIAAGQGASLGTAYALAMNASTNADDGGKRIDVPDIGGGSLPGAARGGDAASARDGAGGARALDDVRHGDPGLPAAPTPKRPTYRWQSLVPGAIK